MNAQDLKNSILQLAIQGKLVEQCEEEGTAKELIEKIKAEKEQLIKDKKIKKEKPLPEIIEDEILFDIPRNWGWVRLGDCCLYSFSGKSPKYTKTPNDNIAIGQRNNQNYGLDFTHLKYCTDEFMKNYNEDMYLKEYDILLNTLGGGTVGRTGLYHNPYSFKCITDGHLFVFRTGDIAFQKYLYYVLKAYQRKIEKDAEGSTNQSFLKLGNVKLYLMPIPPFEEQKRIVAKIEELKPYVEKYDKAYSKVKGLNKKFPEDMQKSIFQYAIQGKLVEHRKEEGTAEELYQQIQEEKANLIREGKIKKQKPLAEITEDEILFDIPENWKFVRLGNLFNISTGLTPSKSNPLFHENGDIPWITSSQTGDLNIEKANNFITKFAVENKNLKIYPKHTMLIAMYGQGKTRGQISELLMDATINQACAALESIIDNSIFRRYILYFQIYNYNILRTGSEGSAQPNLNLDKIRNIIVPLPPLEEQKRIVEKIEELLPYTKQLVK